jgi:N-acetylglucosaminyldiphosphoundecaprenol N-acetyl-beta-D-mannosaminyltransferase
MPEALKLRTEPTADCARHDNRASERKRKMEADQIINSMTGLKFYGIRNGLALRDELHPGLEYWPPLPESMRWRPSTGMPEDVMSIRESAYFLGSRFDIGSTEEAVCNILAAMRGSFKYVVTPNVHHMVRLLEDPALQPLYEQAWHVFCDSRVLARIAWFSGRRLTVITGSDLTAHLIARAAELRLTIAIIGPTAADCARLEDRYPRLDVKCHTPPMGFIKSEHEVEKCIDFVAKSQAPLIFLAMGTPQQEILASHIADHPQVRGVGLCIGASIDFLTGKQHRAPIWLQKVGLEWLHRLLSDPRRLAPRYLIECPRIFYLLIKKNSVTPKPPRTANARP